MNSVASFILFVLTAFTAMAPVDVLAASVQTSSRTNRTSDTINPHWREALCDTCHPKRTDGSVDGSQLREPTARANCDRCHTAAGLSRALHHPYDISPSASAPVPRDWPLDKSRLTDLTRLTCLTCHDIQRQCQGTLKERWKNPRFLRTTPDASPVEFCLNCHARERYQTSSPHDQLDEGGRERQGVCLYCHKERPDPAAQASASTTTLRSAINDLCANCHGTFPHPIGIPHLAPIEEKMLARMSAFERQDEFVIPLPRLQKYLAGQDRLPRYLPVNPRTHEATCITCHNPHEAGVLPSQSPLARGAEGDTVRNFRLRVPRDQICSCCHPM